MEALSYIILLQCLNLEVNGPELILVHVLSPSLFHLQINCLSYAAEIVGEKLKEGVRAVRSHLSVVLIHYIIVNHQVK